MKNAIAVQCTMSSEMFEADLTCAAGDLRPGVPMLAIGHGYAACLDAGDCDSSGQT